MDGKGRALDNIFTERLWRTIKYEEVYLHDYTTPRMARQGLTRYLEFYLGGKLVLVSLVERGGDLCVCCCEGVVNCSEPLSETKS